ncbi:hypothetical protein M8C21_010202 [Ambrosia artemisiifolia]|uniref:Uncharacterized protein n=1 Tax=Ambrosia artemisiifolia TaxID=4212 RepID=A0AAD5CQV0_AMBAR|nr:hypothetical protein M8C21_010202 [Ambrosia artemisiifolia]
MASVEELWSKGLCASPYLGHWTSKTWNNKIAIMSVEDFVDQTENVARAVGKLEVNKIYDCIHLTIENFGLFMNVRIEELKLKESFFGIDGLRHPCVEPKLNVRKEKHKRNHVKTKNPKLTINKVPNLGAPHLMTENSKLTLNKVTNPDETKLNASKEKHENNHLITQISKMTLNTISKPDEPKLNAMKEKHDNNNLMTQNLKSNVNKVSNPVEPKLHVNKEKHEKNHFMTQSSKPTLNKVSNPDEPNLDARKEKHKKNHPKTKNSKLTLKKVSNHDLPKLDARKEKNDNNHLMNQNLKWTMKKVSNPNSVMDIRASLNCSTMPLQTGHWGVPQHQAMTAGPEISWAYQSYYHQPMMGMRAAEGMTAAQRWEPAWGQPGWTPGWGGGPSGSSTGSWVGANGAAYMDDRQRWSQHMQHATDPWGRRLQQHPNGNSVNVYGPPYR